MRAATAATPARLQGAAGRTLSPLTAVAAAAAVPNGRMAARATHAAPQPLNKPTPGNGPRNVLVRFREDDALKTTAQPTPTTAAAVGTAVPVLFRLHAHCAYGQAWGVVGSLSQLGGWDPERAVCMQWSPGDVWYALVHLPQGAQTQFKFVLVDGQAGNKFLGWANQVTGDKNLELQVDVGAVMDAGPAAALVAADTHDAELKPYYTAAIGFGGAPEDAGITTTSITTTSPATLPVAAAAAAAAATAAAATAADNIIAGADMTMSAANITTTSSGPVGAYPATSTPSTFPAPSTGPAVKDTVEPHPRYSKDGVSTTPPPSDVAPVVSALSGSIGSAGFDTLNIPTQNTSPTDAPTTAPTSEGLSFSATPVLKNFVNVEMGLANSEATTTGTPAPTSSALTSTPPRPQPGTEGRPEHDSDPADPANQFVTLPEHLASPKVVSHILSDSITTHRLMEEKKRREAGGLPGEAPHTQFISTPPNTPRIPPHPLADIAGLATTSSSDSTTTTSPSPRAARTIHTVTSAAPSTTPVSAAGVEVPVTPSTATAATLLSNMMGEEEVPMAPLSAGTHPLTGPAAASGKADLGLHGTSHQSGGEGMGAVGAIRQVLKLAVLPGQQQQQQPGTTRGTRHTLHQALSKVGSTLAGSMRSLKSDVHTLTSDHTLTTPSSSHPHGPSRHHPSSAIAASLTPERGDLYPTSDNVSESEQNPPENPSVDQPTPVFYEEQGATITNTSTPGPGSQRTASAPAPTTTMTAGPSPDADLASAPESGTVR